MAGAKHLKKRRAKSGKNSLAMVSMLSAAASLVAVCVLVASATADDQAPITTRNSSIKWLKWSLNEYEWLIDQISPKYLPHDLEHYAQAADEIEKIGAELEAISREAMRADREGVEDWTQIGARVEDLRSDLKWLRGFSATLRAYACGVRAGTKRPRWGVSQVEAGTFVRPSVREFQGHFPRVSSITARPGKMAHMQLVLVPISRDIQKLRISLPGSLKSRTGEIKDLKMNWYMVALRSSEVQPEDRQFPECPYRLRETADSFRLQPDFVQPVWFTVEVPADTASGLYKGTVKFEAEDVHKLEMNIEMKVEAETE